MPKINVMVVDDDIYVRQALEVLLRRHPKTNPYSFFSTTEEAINALGENKKVPDVMVLDIHFQGESENGISAIKKIRKVSPKLKILVSSMNKKQKSIVEAIRSGADGFVWKNESGDGIISAIIKLVEGRFVVTKTVAEKILGQAVKLDKYVEILKDRKEYKHLTESLKKTMYLYCYCGMSAKEIADELCLSVHTINSRIKTVYQLLDARSKAEAFQKLVDRES